MLLNLTEVNVPVESGPGAVTSITFLNRNQTLEHSAHTIDCNIKNTSLVTVRTAVSIKLLLQNI